MKRKSLTSTSGKVLWTIIMNYANIMSLLKSIKAFHYIDVSQAAR